MNQTDEEVYRRLMASGGHAQPDDRHVLACTLSRVLAEGEKPLTEALGLTPTQLGHLLESVFPGGPRLEELVGTEANAGEDAPEEPDCRALLLAGCDHPSDMDIWISCIVARRSMRPEHLWNSLGLRTRQELSDMLRRHFPKLAARNVRNMRWKKFFYREMCQSEGVYVCKSPICDDCSGFEECFGAEDK